MRAFQSQVPFLGFFTDPIGTLTKWTFLKMSKIEFRTSNLEKLFFQIKVNIKY